MENKKKLLSKILYRSSHRGTKEMDILLGNFVKKYINILNDQELNDLSVLLNCEDSILYNWYFNNLKHEGLDENKLRLTIKNLNDSNNTIEYYVRENINSNSNYIKSNSTCIIKRNFFQQPHEIIFRSLSDILRKIGKKYYSSRGKSLDQVVKKIKSKKFSKTTLAGCIIEKINNSLVIYQENRKKSQN